MISKRRNRLAWWVQITLVALCCAAAAAPAQAEVKVIGDFEGNMDSPYAGVSWSTAPGITVPAEFININDPDYQGGVTSGEQAILLTVPQFWNDSYLQLFGGLPMLEDTANFPYMLLDVTSFGGPDTPAEGPEWRQMFSIFNGPVIGWYDANPDADNQHDFPAADFVTPARTETIVIDMTGPDPAVSGDEMIFLNSKAQAVLDDHNDGTPIDLYWELRFVFQGGDIPASPQIQMAVDNVRFCDTLDCTPSTTTPGDHNNDGVVDAADYVVWRKNDTGGQQGYDDWRTNFGSPGTALGSAAAAVPEPATALLVISVLAVGMLCRRRG